MTDFQGTYKIFCEGRNLDDALVCALGGLWEVHTGGGIIEESDIKRLYACTRDEYKPQDSADLSAVLDAFLKDRRLDYDLVDAVVHIREIIYGGGIVDENAVELLRHC